MFARRGLNSSAATDEWVGQRVKGLTWVDSVTILVCPGTDRPGAGEFQRIQLPLRLLAARRSAPDHPGAEGHGHLCGGRDPTARPSRRLCCKKKCGPGPQHWGVGQGPETMIARPLSLGHWGVPASDFRPGEPGNTCQGHIGVAPPPPRNVAGRTLGIHPIRPKPSPEKFKIQNVCERHHIAKKKTGRVCWAGLRSGDLATNSKQVSCAVSPWPSRTDVHVLK